MSSKKLSVLIMCVLALIMAFTLSACTDEGGEGSGTDTAVTVSAISVNLSDFSTLDFDVDAENNTLTYSLNKSVAVSKAMLESELSVTATKSDGTSVTLTASDFTIDWGGFLITDAVRDYTITLTHTATSVSYTFTLKVVDTFASITLAGAKSAFAYGEEFASAGLTVTANYTYSASKSVEVDQCTIDNATAYSATTPGEQTITVSYTEGGVTRSATYTVTVAARILSSIAVSGAKNSFEWGEEFASTGLTVTATYADGGTKNIDVSDCTIDYATAYRSTASGAQTITVSYTENNITKTATYDVSVNSRVLASITVSGAKNMFEWGEAFASTGLTVIATYDNNDTANVTGVVDSANYVARTSNTYLITVSYTERNVTKSASYNVTVKARVLSSIAVTGAKSTFYWGEEFASTGLVTTATFVGGATDTVTAVVDSSTFASRTAGEKTITVNYTEDEVVKSATYSVTVAQRVLQDVAFDTDNAKITFFWGESFEMSGVVATATFTGGVTDVVTPTASYASYNSQASNTYTVQLSYSENGSATFTGSYNVTVLPRVLVSISVSGAKNTFAYGEAFASTGLVVTASYEDGGSATVDTEEGLLINSAAYSATTPGFQTIIVFYTESSITKTTSYNIEVGARELGSIRLNTSAVKTVYFLGDEFTSDGLVVTANYRDGGSETVTGFTVNSASFRNSDTGAYSITVTYQESGITRGANYSVSVYVAEITAGSYANAIRGFYENATTATYKKFFTKGESFSKDLYRIVLDDTSAVELTLALTDFDDATADESKTISFDTSTLTSAIDVTLTYSGSDYLIVPAGDVTTLTVPVTFATYQSYTIEMATEGYSPDVPYNTPFYTQVAAESITLTPAFGEASDVAITAENDFTVSDWTVNALASGLTATVTYTYTGISSVLNDATETDVTATLTFTYNVVDYINGIAFASEKGLASIYYDSDAINWDWDGAEIAPTLASGNGSTNIILNDDQKDGEDSVIVVTGWSWEIGSHVVTFALRSNSAVNCQATVEIRADYIVSVTLTTLPSKTQYYIGESFDPTGVELSAVYNGGGNKTITAAMGGITADGFSTSTAASRNATIYYNGTEVINGDYAYNVNNFVTSFEITSAPTKNAYRKTDSAFSLDGIVYTITLASGDEETLQTSTTGLSVGTAVPNVTAPATDLVCTVYYSRESTGMAALSDTFTYSVVDSIALTWDTLPTAHYKVGDSISLAGGVIKIDSDFDDDITIAADAVAVTYAAENFNTATSTFVAGVSSARTLVLNVEYNSTSSTINYSYNVAAYEALSFSTEPTTTSFAYAESELTDAKTILAGAVLEIAYEGDAFANIVYTIDDMLAANVSSLFEISEFSVRSIVTGSVATVTLTGTAFSDTFTYSVAKQATGINILQSPTKTSYTKDDFEFSLSGLQYEILYSVGTPETVDSASGLVPSAFDVSSAGTHVCTLTLYGTELSDTFEYTVENRLTSRISVSPNAIFVRYANAELTSGTITVSRDFGDPLSCTLDMTDSSVVFAADTSAVGTTSANVIISNATVFESDTYSGTIQLQYTVIDIASIEFTTNPTTTTFAYGSADDAETVLAGATIAVTYTNGTSYSVEIGTDELGSLYLDSFSTSDVTASATASVRYRYDNGDPATAKLDFSYSITDYVSSINLTSNPTKTIYYKNETLNVDGAGIEFDYAYAGATPASIVLEDYNITGFDTDTTGIKNVVFTLKTNENLIFQFNVEVVDRIASATLIAEPSQTAYYVNDLLLIAGASIRVTCDFSVAYNLVGSEILNFFDTSYDFSTAGTKTVTLTAQSNNAAVVNFSAYVIERVPSSIMIVSEPKTNYYVGDVADYRGKIFVEYLIGESTYLDIWDDSTNTFTSGISVAGFDTSTVGTATVTISFDGCNTTYDITVSRMLTSIEVTQLPTKLSYQLGEEMLNLAGGELTKHYATGDDETVDLSDSSVTVTGFSSLEVGEKHISVACANKLCTFVVVVAAPTIQSLAIESECTSHQTTFSYGNDFSFIDIALSITYSYTADGYMNGTVSTEAFESLGITITCPDFDSTPADNGEHSYTATIAANSITYATYNVTVSARVKERRELVITQLPTVTTYAYAGGNTEAFSSEGIVVCEEFYWSDDSTTKQTSEPFSAAQVTVTAPVSWYTGTNYISVSVDTYVDVSYAICVYDDSIASLIWCNNETPESPVPAYVGTTFEEFASGITGGASSYFADTKNILALDATSGVVAYLAYSANLFTSNWDTIVTNENIGTQTLRIAVAGNTSIYIDISVNVSATYVDWYNTPNGYSASTTFYVGSSFNYEEWKTFCTTENGEDAAIGLYSLDNSTLVKPSVTPTSTNWDEISTTTGSKVLSFSYYGSNTQVPAAAYLTFVEREISSISFDYLYCSTEFYVGNPISFNGARITVYYTNSTSDYFSLPHEGVTFTYGTEELSLGSGIYESADYDINVHYNGYTESAAFQIYVSTDDAEYFDVAANSTHKTKFYVDDGFSYDGLIVMGRKRSMSSNAVLVLDVDYEVACYDFYNGDCGVSIIGIGAYSGATASYEIQVSMASPSTDINSISVVMGTDEPTNASGSGFDFVAEVASGAGTYRINVSCTDDFSVVTMSVGGVSVLADSIPFDGINSTVVTITVTSTDESLTPAVYTLTISPWTSKVSYLTVAGNRLSISSPTADIEYAYAMGTSELAISAVAATSYTLRLSYEYKNTCTANVNDSIYIEVGILENNNFTAVEYHTLSFVEESLIESLSVGGVLLTPQNGAFTLTLDAFATSLPFVIDVNDYTAEVLHNGVAVSESLPIVFGKNYYTVNVLNSNNRIVQTISLVVDMPATVVASFSFCNENSMSVYNDDGFTLTQPSDMVFFVEYADSVQHRIELLSSDWSFVSINNRDGYIIPEAGLTSESDIIFNNLSSTDLLNKYTLVLAYNSTNYEIPFALKSNYRDCELFPLLSVKNVPAVGNIIDGFVVVLPTGYPDTLTNEDLVLISQNNGYIIDANYNAENDCFNVSYLLDSAPVLNFVVDIVRVTAAIDVASATFVVGGTVVDAVVDGDNYIVNINLNCGETKAFEIELDSPYASFTLDSNYLRYIGNELYGTLPNSESAQALSSIFTVTAGDGTTTRTYTLNIVYSVQILFSVDLYDSENASYVTYDYCGEYATNNFVHMTSDVSKSTFILDSADVLDLITTSGSDNILTIRITDVNNYLDSPSIVANRQYTYGVHSTLGSSDMYSVNENVVITLQEVDGLTVGYFYIFCDIYEVYEYKIVIAGALFNMMEMGIPVIYVANAAEGSEFNSLTAGEGTNTWTQEVSSSDWSVYINDLGLPEASLAFAAKGFTIYSGSGADTTLLSPDASLGTGALGSSLYSSTTLVAYDDVTNTATFSLTLNDGTTDVVIVFTITDAFSSDATLRETPLLRDTSYYVESYVNFVQNEDDPYLYEASASINYGEMDAIFTGLNYTLSFVPNDSTANVSFGICEASMYANYHSDMNEISICFSCDAGTYVLDVVVTPSLASEAVTYRITFVAQDTLEKYLDIQLMTGLDESAIVVDTMGLFAAGDEDMPTPPTSDFTWGENMAVGYTIGDAGNNSADSKLYVNITNVSSTFADGAIFSATPDSNSPTANLVSQNVNTALTVTTGEIPYFGTATYAVLYIVGDTGDATWNYVTLYIVIQD